MALELAHDKAHVQSIIDNVKIILERTPPELSADIYRNGLYLTGGGSLVSDFGTILANGTGLKVNVADQAVESVIDGIAEIIKNDKFKTVAYVR
ncbi:MAG: rod shape-determining protein [Lachnospiraceae bacterium]|nr:rod shape-determining protein [Lachnospiraceae bacterium]